MRYIGSAFHMVCALNAISMYKLLSITLIFSIAILFSGCNAKAQDMITRKSSETKAHRLFDRGMKYQMARNSEKAIADFKKAAALEPNFIDAHIQVAAYYYERKDFAKAELNFEKALALSETYEPKLIYTTAVSEMEQGKFSEAIENFDKFIRLNSKYKSLNKKAKRYVESSRFKAQNNNRTVPFDPISLGEGVNTEMLEYLPSLTADEETMVITRNDGAQEDFYVSEKVDGVWTRAFPLKSFNSPKTNEGGQSISQDGKLLFYTVCEGRNDFGSCDLYSSEVVNGSWTKAKNMGGLINSREWDTQPSISADKKNLYYTSKRKGGLGGSDIWMSTRQVDGSWGAPKNLGDKINSTGDDASPFIHPDNNTLYFMSDGHPGFGDDDIFYSRRQADGSWGTPINIGYPINTDKHEGSLIVSADATKAYFATDRFNKDKNNNRIDIYSFALYEEAKPAPVTYVKAKVIDAETKQSLSADIEFTDIIRQKSYYRETVDDQGIFLVPLPLGKQYALNIAKEGYFFHSENFALENITSAVDPFLMIVELRKIPVNEVSTTVEKELAKEPIILKNVFFDTGSAVLLPSSEPELDKLHSLLTANPHLNIQLNGHTDNVGKEEDNLSLSVARAKAVYAYLIDKGIAASRLRSKGFGESVPIESNDTAAGRRQNRRTEFEMF